MPAAHCELTDQCDNSNTAVVVCVKKSILCPKRFHLIKKIPFHIILNEINSLLQDGVLPFHFIIGYWENCPLIIGSA